MMTIKRRPSALLCAVGILLSAGSAAAQAQGGTITVGPQPCAAVADLKPVPGVAYTPGVDARGNAVAPADLPGGANNGDLAKSLSEKPVKITSALLGKYGIPASAQPFEGRAELGYVTVRDGKAYLDDKPLSPPETATIADACNQKR